MVVANWFPANALAEGLKAWVPAPDEAPPTSLQAYDLVLRAYPNLWDRRKDVNNRAIKLGRRSLSYL